MPALPDSTMNSPVLLVLHHTGNREIRHVQVTAQINGDAVDICDVSLLDTWSSPVASDYPVAAGSVAVTPVPILAWTAYSRSSWDGSDAFLLQR